ncbi:hypothetical protein [Spiroplasma kunkelii]|nr:hypothetical protein [Spiroplasma kunkelii]
MTAIETDITKLKIGDRVAIGCVNHCNIHCNICQWCETKSIC